MGSTKVVGVRMPVEWPRAIDRVSGELSRNGWVCSLIDRELTLGGDVLVAVPASMLAEIEEAAGRRGWLVEEWVAKVLRRGLDGERS